MRDKETHPNAQYKARLIPEGKIAIYRGNGVEPIYFDLASLIAALRAVNVTV